MSDSSDKDVYLAHYGVLGMKWGVRKRQPTSSGLETLSRRQRKKQLKAKIKLAKKANRQEYKKAKRLANERFDKDTAEYNKAYNKLNTKFNRDEYRAKKKYDSIDEITKSVGLGSITGYNRVKTSNEISRKREIAQEALDMKYSDVIDKAYKRRSNSIKKAKSVYKANKKKLISEFK